MQIASLARVLAALCPLLSGPGLWGKVGTGTKQAITYNAALLFRVTSASPRTALRVQAEYEF